MDEDKKAKLWAIAQMLGWGKDYRKDKDRWHLVDREGRVVASLKMEQLLAAYLPDFIDNPLATDEVRAWLESQRLWIDERSYEHYFTHTKTYARRYSCIIRGRERETWAAGFCETRGDALCDAALLYSKSDQREEWLANDSTGSGTRPQSSDAQSRS